MQCVCLCYAVSITFADDMVSALRGQSHNVGGLTGANQASQMNTKKKSESTGKLNQIICVVIKSKCLNCHNID